MAISQKPSPLWNVPYQRNKFFTERDNALQILRQELQMRDAVALSQPQAITGLGGIGKTQLAGFYHEQGKFAQAEPLYKRALAICERVLGRNHPATNPSSEL